MTLTDLGPAARRMADLISGVAPDSLDAPMSVPGQEAQRRGLFGPVVEVPEDAPLLDRVIGLSGRDPAWPTGS